MFDRRYDEIKSGKVKLIPGDEVFARLREKSAAARLTGEIEKALENLVSIPHAGNRHADLTSS